MQYTPYPINGTGKYEFPDGSFYDGDWEEGLFHGQGTFAWKSSGDRYTGSFRRGQMHGHGRYEFRNGDAFDGTFVDGKPVGRGEYVWSREHQAYHGEWADGIQHGGASDRCCCRSRSHSCPPVFLCALQRARTTTIWTRPRRACATRAGGTRAASTGAAPWQWATTACTRRGWRAGTTRWA